MLPTPPTPFHFSRIVGNDVFCNITDIKNTNIREYTYCSGRGTCDFSSGTCYCFDGYTGESNIYA